MYHAMAAIIPTDCIWTMLCHTNLTLFFICGNAKLSGWREARSEYCSCMQQGLNGISKKAKNGDETGIFRGRQQQTPSAICSIKSPVSSAANAKSGAKPGKYLGSIRAAQGEQRSPLLWTEHEAGTFLSDRQLRPQTKHTGRHTNQGWCDMQVQGHSPTLNSVGLCCIGGLSPAFSCR